MVLLQPGHEEIDPETISEPALEFFHSYAQLFAIEIGTAMISAIINHWLKIIPFMSLRLISLRHKP